MERDCLPRSSGQRNEDRRIKIKDQRPKKERERARGSEGENDSVKNPCNSVSSVVKETVIQDKRPKSKENSNLILIHYEKI